MLNLLHPKNTIDVSVSVFVEEGIEVVSISLAIVVEIIVDTISDKVWFLVREVVSIALGIVVAISDKVWVSFTIVVSALFCFFSFLQANSPSEFSTHSLSESSISNLLVYF